MINLVVGGKYVYIESNSSGCSLRYGNTIVIQEFNEENGSFKFSKNGVMDTWTFDNSWAKSLVREDIFFQDHGIKYADLVSVIREAFDDGLLSYIEETLDYIRWSYRGGYDSITFNKKKFIGWNYWIKKYMDDINEKYNKEWIIKSENDIMELIRGSTITLANGNKLRVIKEYYVVEDKIVVDAIIYGCTTSQNIEYGLSYITLKDALIKIEARNKDEE